MGALKDLSDAITAAGPPEAGKRRYVLVGQAAGPAIVADLVIDDKLKGQGWRECLRYLNREARPGELGVAFVPTDDFPGFEIVDRVHVLKSQWL